MPDPKPPTMRATTNHERFMDSIQGYLDALRQQPVAQVAGAIGDVMDAGFRGNLGREDLHVGNVTIPAEAQKVAAIVYHGSPHKFTKFDASKVGTGEGRQAYGHGVPYLADQQSVARSYMGEGPWKVDGREVPDWVGKRMKMGDHDGVIRDLERQIAYDTEGIKTGRDPYPQSAERRVADQRAVVDAVRKAQAGARITPPGYLYEVDLPDEAIAKMLDWDAPLSQQPEASRVLSGVYAKRTGHQPQWVSSATGESGYRALDAGRMSAGESSQEASRLLREAGIPGIKYYDQASRNPSLGQGDWYVQGPSKYINRFSSRADLDAYMKQVAEWDDPALYKITEPTPRTRNYVVFDETLPTILKVNGKPVNPALEALKKAK